MLNGAPDNGGNSRLTSFVEVFRGSAEEDNLDWREFEIQNSVAQDDKRELRLEGSRVDRLGESKKEKRPNMEGPIRILMVNWWTRGGWIFEMSIGLGWIDLDKKGLDERIIKDSSRPTIELGSRGSTET